MRILSAPNSPMVRDGLYSTFLFLMISKSRDRAIDEKTFQSVQHQKHCRLQRIIKHIESLAGVLLGHLRQPLPVNLVPPSSVPGWPSATWQRRPLRLSSRSRISVPQLHPQAERRLPPPFLALLWSVLLQPPLDHLLHLAGPGTEDLRQYLLGRLQLHDPGADRPPGLDRLGLLTVDAEHQRLASSVIFCM